jgi:hypothetical protein
MDEGANHNVSRLARRRDGKAFAMITRLKAAPMTLSPSSSIIIDLLLLADATVAGDKAEVRRLARRVEKMAEARSSCVIAKHARVVEMLAMEDAPIADLSVAVDRLLSASEREVHDIGIWAEGSESDSDRRSA